MGELTAIKTNSSSQVKRSNQEVQKYDLPVLAKKINNLLQEGI